jgi:hypothetical protein
MIALGVPKDGESDDEGDERKDCADKILRAVKDGDSSALLDALDHWALIREKSKAVEDDGDDESDEDY